jgi:small subunit ribosomal protein S17
MATDETQNNETNETAETAEVAETSEAAAAEATETTAAEAAPEAAEPERKTRSRRHVPRSERRPRSKQKRVPPAARKPIVRLPKPDTERGRRQERRGVVVSDSSDKTIVVKVDLIKLHPKYKKVVRSTVKFHAHDERNEAGMGDIVRIVETRPLSKTKNWRLAEIVEKAR